MGRKAVVMGFWEDGMHVLLRSRPSARFWLQCTYASQDAGTATYQKDPLDIYPKLRADWSIAISGSIIRGDIRSLDYSTHEPSTWSGNIGHRVSNE